MYPSRSAVMISRSNRTVIARTVFHRIAAEVPAQRGSAWSGMDLEGIIRSSGDLEPGHTGVRPVQRRLSGRNSTFASAAHSKKDPLFNLRGIHCTARTRSFAG